MSDTFINELTQFLNNLCLKCYSMKFPYYSGKRRLFFENGKDTRNEFIPLLIKDVDLESTSQLRNIEFLNHLASVCAYNNTVHEDFDILAGRIVIEAIKLQLSIDEKLKLESRSKILCPKTLMLMDILINNDYVSKYDDYNYIYSYMSIKTLMRGYLLPFELPVHMIMRVACGIWSNLDDISEALTHIQETITMMLDQNFTHSSPTLFNSGLNVGNQLASCFLLQIGGDNLEDIYKSITDCALISKKSGGIGITVSNIRSKGSSILKGVGKSSGIVPMLQVFDRTASYINQGGKRKGAFAIYLEPWHSDIKEFIAMKNPHGSEDTKATSLFYGLMIPGEFMKRVESDSYWNLFSPSDVNYELEELYGEEFSKRYQEFENDPNIPKTKIKARSLWNNIIKSQLETGTPYIIFKDSCNERSNQKNLGTIKTANLCAEIVQYVSPTEVSTCTIGSISLPSCIDYKTGSFDFDKLRKITRRMTLNLNQILDINDYPLPEAKRSSEKHRPIGIGIQGLADVFAIFRVSFDSEQSKILNRKISEHIYYAALETSCELAQKQGKYESFDGSPFSKGLLQFDLSQDKDNIELSIDWSDLKQRIKEHGTRNSLLTAYMPTASTSQILGNNDCFEPFSSLIYKRQALSGDFMIINKHLINMCRNENIWNEKLFKTIVRQDGSIDNIENIPENIKSIFKTVWTMKVKNILDMARDRGNFTDQSQSMSLFLEEGNETLDSSGHAISTKLTSYLMYAWKIGLKTGIYYTRTKPSCSALKVTVSDEEALVQSTDSLKSVNEDLSCEIKIENGIVCTSCSG